jgi:spermidine/putrescine transport system substrate-binding protein
MKKLLLATTASLTLASAAGAEGVLNIFNWGNYTSPEMIEKFEAETGIDVTITDYDSNDTALARISAGGHGFDLVVPTHNFVPIYVEKGLIQPLDLTRLPNHANIAPEWRDVPWDPGRTFTVPWQWGTTGVSVNQAVYPGNPHTADIFLDPPAELVGKVNVVPEMSDVMALSIMAKGGEPCTDDREVLRQVRDALIAAKPSWIAMDYGTVEQMSAGNWAASVNWNGASMRARLVNPDVVFGFPATGYPIWMDSVALLTDAQNVDNAYRFLDFIMEPEHAAMLSEFARYSPGIAGAEAFLPDYMLTAPELNPPEELRAAGRWVPVCPAEVQALYTAIWTELMK